MGLFTRDDNSDIEPETLYDTLALPDQESADEEFISERELSGAVPSSDNVAYGIEDAIELMRQLPQEHADLVMTVVKKTLESTHVNINDIIADADHRESHIEHNNAALLSEIEALKTEIEARQARITELNHVLQETSHVREQLQRAMEFDTGVSENQAAADQAPTDQLTHTQATDSSASTQQVHDDEQPQTMKNVDNNSSPVSSDDKVTARPMSRRAHRSSTH